MTMEELAVQCEAATGGDQEIDSLIRCAVFAPDSCHVAQSKYNGAWCIFDGVGRDGRERLWDYRGISRLQRLGEFTSDLNAAASLVTSGKWSITALGDRDRWQAFAWGEQDGVEWSEAATPARALCAAALRAMRG